MKSVHTIGATALAAALLAGCGGGGSGGAPAAPPAPTASVVITSSNQDLVARAAANAVLSSSATAAVTPSANADRVQTASSTPSGLAGARSLSTLLLGLTRGTLLDRTSGKTSAAAPSDDAVRAQAILSRTENCAVGGTATFALDDRDGNNQASAGDVLSVTFSQCRTSATEMVNGGLTASFTIVQQAPALSMTASITYSQLTATSSEGSFAINGSFDFTLTRQGSVDTAQLSIGGNGLAAAVATPSYSDTVTLLAGYSVTATYDSAALPPGSSVAGLSTLAVNGAISAASLGGTIVLSTPLPIRQYDVDPYPREGQVQVRGANNGLLVLTVLSTTTVRVQLDANNDGTFEATKDVPWGDLI
jgi:hypothetical protein